MLLKMLDFGFGVGLKRIYKGNLDRLRHWRNDRQIWKWCRQYDLIDEYDQLRWHEKISKDPTISMYMIWFPAESDNILYIDPVGVCGFTDIDKHNQRAEFSCYIAPDKQGKGLGGKALKTLFSHGFYNLNLNCIWGESYESNPARKLFSRLGMIQEGCRRQYYFRDGVFEDAYIYSCLRESWSPSR